MSVSQGAGLAMTGMSGFISALGLSALFIFAAPGQGIADPPTPGNTASPAPLSPAPKPAPSENPGAGDNQENPADSAAQTVDVAAMPTAIISGQAKWADGFSTILDAETQLKAAVEKAGLKATDRPITVFTSTDDNGFSYQAMLPLAEKPAGKTELSDTVKLGMSPSGKALKFRHRGPYDDIDSTYDLITAYLDEKGLEAQDYFLEEYLTDLKTADDPSLAVDIYVFIK